ncbi:polysaccharide deacetylase family protein [Heliobacterium chlorum]|uniref:Polysaccharide deacetylase family protein n=1 Tax=Heliobacterium chlorum TaxID=2698 RepID=A0ABR7SZH5_HELCL|nr:polysaccharide deacetylase family protein [Heliobacterium chlorum]MBC9783943.1 polysaccharide deacetylase family protein [Heliobacterium chlorum]
MNNKIGCRQQSCMIFAILISILLGTTLSPLMVTAGTAPIPEKKLVKSVLIVYPDGRAFRGTTARQEQDWAQMMQNLLGHFEVDISLCTSADYHEAQLESFDSLIYLGTFEEKVPSQLLRDIAKTTKPVMWLGKNIDELGDAGGPRFVTKPVARQRANYEYKGKSLTNPKEVTLNLIEKYPQDSQIWAWVDSPQGRRPFGLQRQNFWYVANTDLHSKSYLLVADQLFDFMGKQAQPEKWATVRIEDVHPLRSPETLRKIADVLKARQIPFMVTVIPVYVNPQTNSRVFLAQRPELIEALRYMETCGGTILIHGFTHQVGNDETALGFEFWDAVHERAIIPPERPHWAEERLNQGIVDLRSLGLHPYGMTVPHYAMGSETYKAMRQQVRLLAGSPQISDQSRQTQKIPYILKKDQYGYLVVPENLGLVDMNLTDPVTPMLEEAQEIALVRECAAGAFFHSFLEPTSLAKLVDGLKDQGYTFLDVRSLPVQEINADQSKLTGQDLFWDPLLGGSLRAESETELAPAVKDTVESTMTVLLIGIVIAWAIRRRTDDER